MGKSHWLRRNLRAKATFDLLDTRLQLDFLRAPHELEARLGSLHAGDWAWIDEVQKVPRLLDEVHRLMELRRFKFALSGSSARKLFRQGANLLAGRASTRYLEGLSWGEMQPVGPSLDDAIAWGTLPMVTLEIAAAKDILGAYVNTYIREEVKEEGLVRKLDPFLRFLDIAGQVNGQIMNAESVARDAQVPRRSVDSYFSILEDTLMTHRLPSYRPGAKVRESGHPKFYWFDPGVARAAARRLDEPIDDLWRGSALETLVFHEIRSFLRSVNRDPPVGYYRTRSGQEIDFVVELARRTHKSAARIVCIEVKGSRKWKREWERPMRELARSSEVQVTRMVGVYRGTERLRHDEVEVLPWHDFTAMLDAGEIM